MDGEASDLRRIYDVFDQFGEVIHFADSDACGVSRDSIRRAEARGKLVRWSKSAFVRADVWDRLDPWQRFRLQAIAFGLCSGPHTYLSGLTAAAVLNLPVLDSPPALPIAIRPGDPHRAPNRTVHGRVRWGHLPPHHQTIRNRVRVASPAYVAVDVARHGTRADGLIIADAVLRTGVHREVLARLTNEMERYPGIDNARWVVEHADSRSESPVESLGRLAFLTMGRPAPLSNVWIWKGDKLFRADHYLPECGVVVEADGALKYNSRPDAAKVVEAQSRREELLRSWGLEIVRYTYAEARFQPERLVRRAQAAGTRQGGRPLTATWSQDDPRMHQLRGFGARGTEFDNFMHAGGS